MNYLNKTMTFAMGGEDPVDFARRWEATFGAKLVCACGSGITTVLFTPGENPVRIPKCAACAVEDP